MRVATPLDQPRAIGAAKVGSKTGQHGSCIDNLRHSGALKVVFPRRDNCVEAILVNTAGGVTGGDRFDISAQAGEGSHLMLTTQAAERAYKAQPGQVGSIRTTLKAEAGSTLYWLPQETILYNGAAISRRLKVEIAPTSTFLMVEPVLFGRRAMNEDVTSLSFRDRIQINCDQRPVYHDGLDLDGNAAARLNRPAIGGGTRAMASLVWHHTGASAKLSEVRSCLDGRGGASMLQENLMVVRLLAEDGFILRKSLLPVLDLLTRNTLPQSWRL